MKIHIFPVELIKIELETLKMSVDVVYICGYRWANFSCARERSVRAAGEEKEAGSRRIC